MATTTTITPTKRTPFARMVETVADFQTQAAACAAEEASHLDDARTLRQQAEEAQQRAAAAAGMRLTIERQALAKLRSLMPAVEVEKKAEEKTARAEQPPRKRSHKKKPKAEPITPPEPPAAATGPVSVADFGLSVAEMCEAVSAGSIKEDHLKRLIRLNGESYAVLGWVEPEPGRHTFTIYRLIPAADYADGDDETYAQRKARTRKPVDLSKPGGLNVAGPDGARYVIDDREPIVIEAGEGTGGA